MSEKTGAIMTKMHSSATEGGTPTGFRRVFIAQVYAFYNLELGLKRF